MKKYFIYLFASAAIYGLAWGGYRLFQIRQNKVAQNIEVTLEKAKTEFLAGNKEQAFAKLQALWGDFHLARAAIILARLNYYYYDFAEAEKWFDEAPNSEEFRNWRTEFGNLLKQRRPDGWFETDFILACGSGFNSNIAGILLMRASLDKKHELQFIERAAKADPSCAQIDFAKVMAIARTKGDKSALGYANEKLKIDPNAVGLILAKAKIYATGKNFEQSQSLLRKPIQSSELKFESMKVALENGLAMSIRKDREKNTEYCAYGAPDSAIRFLLWNIGALKRVGSFWSAKRDIGLTIHSYSKAIELAPKAPEVHYLLAKFYYWMKEEKNAIRLLNQELELNPNSKEASSLMEEIKHGIP